jgi:hypothetical protein
MFDSLNKNGLFKKWTYLHTYEFVIIEFASVFITPYLYTYSSVVKFYVLLAVHLYIIL